jgi:peptidyl-prolyl cis-trans isomerase C
MRRLVLGALGAMIVAGCATSKGHLATVNGERITGQDLQAEFSRRHAAMGKFMAGDEGMVRQYVDTVVSRRLMLQEAAGVGLTDEPAIVTAVSDYEEAQVADRVYDAEVRQNVKATDEEVKVFYEKIGPAYLAREIVVATKAEADAISAELKAGGDFEKLAQTHSTAPTANRGGRMSPIQYGTADETTETILLALADGAKSEPYELDGAWHILWSERKVEIEKKVELAQIEPKVRQVIEERKAVKRDREFLKALRARYAARVTWEGLTLEGVRAAAEAKDDGSAAEWQGGRLSRSEFASRIDLAKVEALPAEKQPARLGKLLEELLAQKLLFAEGTARGLTASPEVVQGVRRYREQLIESELFEKYVYRGVAVTDEEVKAEFEGHPELYRIPEARHVTQILVSELEAAKAVKAKLDSGAPFDEVQAEYASDPAAERGSKKDGWVEREKLGASFAEVFTTDAGETTQPIHSNVGYHVVKVLEVRPEQPLLFANVRTSIHDDLLQRKKSERTKQWSDKLRQNAKIKINKAGIKAYVKAHPAPKDGEAPPAPSSHGPSGKPSMPADGSMGAMGGEHMGGMPAAPSSPETAAPAAAAPAPAAPAAPSPAASPQSISK